MSEKIKLSAQKAIYAHCKGCTYDPKAGGSWIEQVEARTISNCELYEHRKLTAKTRRLRREKELALMTPAERRIVEEKMLKQQQIMLDFHAKKDLHAW